MELSEFVSDIIQDIAQAVESAQGKYTQENQRSLPPVVCPSEIDRDKEHCIDHGIRRYVTYVDFDVSMVVSDNDSKEGSAGIKAHILSLHGGLGHEERSELVQRVRFRIPVVLPSIKTDSSYGKY